MIAAVAPSEPRKGPLSAPPPSYVMSAKRLTIPIVNTNLKAGEWERACVPCVIRRPSLAVRLFRRAGRRRRRQCAQVGEPERLLDGGDSLERILEAILAEHPVLEILELIAELLVLVARQGAFPRWKDDGVLDRGMMLVHANETGEGAGETHSVRWIQSPLLGHPRNVVGDLPTSLMLRGERPRERAVLTAGVDERNEHVPFFQRALVIVLTQGSEQRRRPTERIHR